MHLKEMHKILSGESKCMLGKYLSGTGNTKYCVTKLVKLIDASADVVPLEDEFIIDKIKRNETVILGYPTQFSNAPYMVRDFIQMHASLWKGRKMICVATMGAFSGDGSGCAARLLKKYGAVILGGVHIKMPDSICDSKMLKKSAEENEKIIRKADEKLKEAAERIRQGDYPAEGLTIFAHIAGLFGQRLWFYKKTAGYTDQLKINQDCVGCGKCAKICPMKNITMENGRPHPGSKCTMCYRCICNCPQKAITLLGSKVILQYKFEDSSNLTKM